MKTRAVFLFVCCWCASPGLRAEERVASFAALPSGDELFVEFNDRGCFHDRTYELTFRRGEALTVSIDRVHEEWSEDRQEYDTTKTAVYRDAILSPEGAVCLDRLIAYYRSEPEGGCTTKHYVTIEHRRRDRVLATEKFLDANCSIGRPADVLTIPELVGR